MALDYTVKYASKIANRFKLASKTNRAAGHEYEFTGAKSVKIYSMVPAELTDYQRGGKRYGDVTDLEYTTQEMLCTQAKAFTKHLEALDGSDIAVETAAGKFLRMEIDERVVAVCKEYLPGVACSLDDPRLPPRARSSAISWTSRARWATTSSPTPD